MALEEIADEAARYTVHIGCFADIPYEQIQSTSADREIKCTDRADGSYWLTNLNREQCDKLGGEKDQICFRDGTAYSIRDLTWGQCSRLWDLVHEP